MLLKYFFLIVLSIGVLGREVPEKDTWEEMFPTAYCGEETMPYVRAALTTFNECKKRIYTDKDNAMEFKIAYATNSYKNVFKTYCASSLLLKKCASPVFQSMASCVSPSLLRTSQKELETVIDFLCENEGSRLFLLYLKGPQCMKEKKVHLAYCEAMKESGIKKLIGIYGSGPAIPVNRMCTVEITHSACEVAAFKECSLPEPGAIAEEMHQLLVSHLNCTQPTQNPQAEDTNPQENLTGMVQLNKKMLELIVRRYEIDTWARENELKIQHTDLTSDIEKVQL